MKIGQGDGLSPADEMGEDADVYALRDGKIVRAQIYTDTAMMERVFAGNRSPPKPATDRPSTPNASS